MRWLFENPQILLLIAGAVAYWLNQRRLAKEQAAMEELSRQAPTDDEMAERTRRIQEEIRRRIAERQGQSPLSPRELVETMRAPAPPPMPAEPPPLELPPLVEETPGAAEIERSLRQQREYAEAIERLERQAAAQARLADTYREAGGGNRPMAEYAGTAAAASSQRSGPRLAGLGDREALRRAIVLREVLGAPKALQ